MEGNNAKTKKSQSRYARRIAQGEARGLTRTQARGHPRPFEQSASQRTSSLTYGKRLEAGVKEIRHGTPLTKAAKMVGVSPELLRKYVHHAGVATKAGRRWRLNPDLRKRPV